MLFLGHQGKVELAGGSLALGFANITANSVLKGLTMGMDPICCQAYGAKRYSLLNQTFLRVTCLLLVVSIPISILWLNMGPVLQMLGQDPQVTKVAQVFMLFSIPELLAQAHLNPLRTFLRTQGLATPITVVASCAAVLHLPINYFLAIHLNLGVKGIALATGLNSINMILGLLSYLFFSKKPLKPWQGTSFFSIFHGWKPLLSLALPSCVSVCLEWWWYEIMLFLCGLLRNPQATVATMGILIQTLGFLYVFPFSLSIALTTRIGHSLGASEPTKARRSAIIGFIIALTFGVIAFIFLMFVRRNLGKVFTNETQIIDMVTSVLPILGLCEICNWSQTVSCGILSGTARPYLDISKGRGAADQAFGRGRSRGWGRGKISSNTFETFGSSSSTLTTPVMPQVAGSVDQPFIMVIVRSHIGWGGERSMPYKDGIRAGALIDVPARALGSLRGVDCKEMMNVIKLMYDRPLPNYTKIPAETRKRCCTSFGMLTTTWPSGRYSTIGWVDDSNRCWMMFIMGGTSKWASFDRRKFHIQILEARLNSLCSLSKVGRTPSMDLRPQSSTPMRFGARLPQSRTKTAYTRCDRSSPTASAPRRLGRRQTPPPVKLSSPSGSGSAGSTRTSSPFSVPPTQGHGTDDNDNYLDL
ncbi:Protein DETOXIFICATION [Arachis hypogaea]|nr:Protein DETOXIFICATION [Arachis hypogaea]